MKFAANAVRLQLHALAYNLANFLRTLAKPKDIEMWSLTSLRARNEDMASPRCTKRPIEAMRRPSERFSPPGPIRAHGIRRAIQPST